VKVAGAPTLQFRPPRARSPSLPAFPATWREWAGTRALRLDDGAHHSC
jgi:hypothetical protein